MLTRSLLLAVLALCSACREPEPRSCVPLPHEYELEKAKDEAEELGAATPCGRACKKLRDMSCLEGHKIKGGDSCYQTCTLDAAAGTTLPVKCVEKATDANYLRSKCGVRCLPIPPT